MVFFEHAEE
jgi:hypothetical protein